MNMLTKRIRFADHWNDKYNPRDKSWIEEQDSLDTAILLLSFRSHKGQRLGNIFWL